MHWYTLSPGLQLADFIMRMHAFTERGEVGNDLAPFSFFQIMSLLGQKKLPGINLYAAVDCIPRPISDLIEYEVCILGIISCLNLPPIHCFTPGFDFHFVCRIFTHSSPLLFSAPFLVCLSLLFYVLLYPRCSVSLHLIAEHIRSFTISQLRMAFPLCEWRAVVVGEVDEMRLLLWARMGNDLYSSPNGETSRRGAGPLPDCCPLLTLGWRLSQ